MERNVENWPHALLIERRPQIAPTNVIDFGSTPASAQIGMRSNRVTQSKGAVLMSRNPQRRSSAKIIYMKVNTSFSN